MTPFLSGVERLVLLRDGLRSADRAVARRAAMVAAAAGGESPASVAKRFGRSPDTVEHWVHLYKQHRDVLALGGAHSSEWPFARPEDLTPALVAEARAGHRRRVAPKLPPSALRAVRILVRTSSDPAVRLGAAIVWALERGLPPRLVAIVSGRSPQAVHQMWERWSGAGGGDAGSRIRDPEFETGVTPSVVLAPEGHGDSGRPRRPRRDPGPDVAEIAGPTLIGGDVAG